MGNALGSVGSHDNTVGPIQKRDTPPQCDATSPGKAGGLWYDIIESLREKSHKSIQILQIYYYTGEHSWGANMRKGWTCVCTDVACRVSCGVAHPCGKRCTDVARDIPTIFPQGIFLYSY